MRPLGATTQLSFLRLKKSSSMGLCHKYDKFIRLLFLDFLAGCGNALALEYPLPGFSRMATAKVTASVQLSSFHCCCSDLWQLKR